MYLVAGGLLCLLLLVALLNDEVAEQLMKRGEDDFSFWLEQEEIQGSALYLHIAAFQQKDHELKQRLEQIRADQMRAAVRNDR